MLSISDCLTWLNIKAVKNADIFFVWMRRFFFTFNAIMFNTKFTCISAHKNYIYSPQTIIYGH